MELDGKECKTDMQACCLSHVEGKQEGREAEVDVLCHMQWCLQQESPQCPDTGMIRSVGTQWLRTWAPQPDCRNSNVSFNSHLLWGPG